MRIHSSLFASLLLSSLVGCGGSGRNSFGDDTGDCTLTGTCPDDAGMPGVNEDLFGVPPRDMAGVKPGPGDMATGGGGPVDMSNPAITGSVGAKGGKVNRLFFGFSGDARPMDCNNGTPYPTAIVNEIYTRMAAANVEFAMDLGDHMFVCQNGSQSQANTQMGYYVSATKKLGNKPTFFTLGNHDCVSMTNPSYCSVGGFETVNFRAFMSALSAISAQPYYSFDVQTDFGVARFVVIADNAWSTTQANWLKQTLADGQANAKYMFVFRHHPLDNTDMPDFQTITSIIKSYKHTLVFTGHTHEFKLDKANDQTGRTLVIGNGGAPLAVNFTWYGFGTVEQIWNGNVMVKLYDQATGNLMGTFTVSPM